jgi:hypothetical protein
MSSRDFLVSTFRHENCNSLATKENYCNSILSLSSLLVPGNFYTFLNPVILTYFPSCLRSKGGHRKFSLLVCKFLGSFRNHKSANFLDVPVRKLQIRKFFRKKVGFLIQIHIGFPLILFFTYVSIFYTTKCHLMCNRQKSQKSSFNLNESI